MRGKIYTDPDQLRGLERYRDLSIRLDMGQAWENVVECGKCQTFALTGTIYSRNARIAAERMGWRQGQYNWTCPACIKVAQAEAAEKKANRREVTQMPREYGKWFYPHKGEVPTSEDCPGNYSETVIVCYDEGPDPKIVAGVYCFPHDSWDEDGTPWCWMYDPPREWK